MKSMNFIWRWGICRKLENGAKITVTYIVTDGAMVTEQQILL